MRRSLLPMVLLALPASAVITASSAHAQRVNIGAVAGAAFPYGPTGQKRGAGWRAALTLGVGETRPGPTARLELGHAYFPGKRGFDGIRTDNAVVLVGVAGGDERVRVLAQLGAGVHSLRTAPKRGVSRGVAGVAGGVGLRLGQRRAVRVEIRSDALLSDYGNADGDVVTYNSFVVGFSM